MILQVCNCKGFFILFSLLSIYTGFSLLYAKKWGGVTESSVESVEE